MWAYAHHALCDLRWIGESLRSDDGEQSIAGRIFRNNVDRFHEPLRVGVGQHVHGIAATPVRREKVIELAEWFGRQHGKFAAGRDESVGCQHAGTAGIGDDAEPRPARARLLAQDLRHIKKVRDVLHAQHAAATERGFQHLVTSGQRSGVRCGRARCGFGASGLDDDDRLAQRNLARRGKKRARISDGLHVDQNALGVGIVAEVDK